jgi:hypothetical protein
MIGGRGLIHRNDPMTRLDHRLSDPNDDQDRFFSYVFARSMLPMVRRVSVCSGFFAVESAGGRRREVFHRNAG